MFKFFKNNDPKDNNKNDDELLSKTASLFIHAAKIDENYTEKEKEIIKRTLIQLGIKESKADKIMLTAEINEEKSNQILDFTREIKNANNDFKIKVTEALWSIIYSNKEADMYESSLMRRLSGLLYLDNRVMGEIKEKVKKKFAK
tara:strand:+ start:1077 stop:1511 length:435 start_codon:yes stop_codon:yes gene_type:complete